MMPRQSAERRPRLAWFVVTVGAIALGADAIAAGDRRPDSWTFEVVEVAPADPAGHIITLRPSPPGRDFPRSCETFVIYSLFDVATWSFDGQANVSLDGHRQAVEVMQRAALTNDLVRVGVIHNGFAAIEGKETCEVASRAFQYTLRNGQHAIISFFDEP